MKKPLHCCPVKKIKWDPIFKKKNNNDNDTNYENNSTFVWSLM